MVHFSDWFPTLLAAAGIPVPDNLKLDGVNVWPVLQGEPGQVCTTRYWQWNRYQPVITSNAAVRDGDWKLVRPVQEEAMQTDDDIHWLAVSMYGPEYFIKRGIFKDAEPRRELPLPVAPELYNLVSDPLEQTNLAEQYPDIARALLHKLENWFEDVEREFREVYPVR
jgi:arylsulfatase A